MRMYLLSLTVKWGEGRECAGHSSREFVASPGHCTRVYDAYPLFRLTSLNSRGSCSAILARSGERGGEAAEDLEVAAAAARAVVLVNGEHATAWNLRKRFLLALWRASPEAKVRAARGVRPHTHKLPEHHDEDVVLAT